MPKAAKPMVSIHPPVRVMRFRYSRLFNLVNPGFFTFIKFLITCFFKKVTAKTFRDPSRSVFSAWESFATPRGAFFQRGSPSRPLAEHFFSVGNDPFPRFRALIKSKNSLGVPHFTPLLLAAGMAVVSDSFLRFPARKRCGEACYPDFPMRI